MYALFPRSALCYTHFMKRKLLPLFSRKYLSWGALCVCLLFVLLAIYADAAVNASAVGRVYDSAIETPHKKVALLLGSNKYVPDGRENLFYTYRIDATVALYEAGKVEFVLVSGDNRTAAYSEPDLMRVDLVHAGIPEHRIFLDYAGFRTWDSVIRAHEVFLENDFIIVSQAFHNKRALFIAQANDIEAIAFNAKDVSIARSPRIWIRERLARIKLMVDIFFHKQPTFLGDTITITAT